MSRTSAVLPVTRSYTACTSVHLINKLLALPDHGFASCLGTSIYLPLSKRGGELGDSGARFTEIARGREQQKDGHTHAASLQ